VSEFEIRVFNKDKDYDIIVNWFNDRNFDYPKISLLPPTGILLSHDKKDIAAGFLFKTDANVAVIGNLISNPYTDKKIRQKAINYILEILSKIAKDGKFELVTCATNIEKLGSRFEELGFLKTDTNVSHYGRLLCHYG
jgi:hypothetical protein